MGQIIGSAAKPKRCNLSQLSQLGTPAAGEHILVSSDNSMNAAGQGNFDCYIVGDGTTAATALTLRSIAADAVEENNANAVSSRAVYESVLPTFDKLLTIEQKASARNNADIRPFVEGQIANYFTGGYISSAGGKIIEMDGWCITDFIPFTSGTIVWRFGDGGHIGGDYACLVYFKENNTYGRDYLNYHSSNAYNYDRTVTPNLTGCKWIRAAFYKTYKGKPNLTPLTINGVDYNVKEEYKGLAEKDEHWKPFPLGKLVNAYVKADGSVDTANQDAPYRVAMDSMVTLPFEGVKIRIKTPHNYPYIVAAYLIYASANGASLATLYLYPWNDYIQIPQNGKSIRVCFTARNRYQSSSTNDWQTITPQQIENWIDSGDLALEYYDEDVSTTRERNVGTDVKASAARRVLDVAQNVNNGMNKLPIFAHISDLHGDVTRYINFLQYCDEFGVDFALNTGDSTMYNHPNHTSFVEYYAGKSNTPLLFCIGNHESWPTGQTTLFEDNMAGLVTQQGYLKAANTPADHCYYYKDFDAKKIRVIAINYYEDGVYNGKIGQTQITWFINTLADTPNGYGVVVILHSPEDHVVAPTGYDKFMQPSPKYGDNYQPNGFYVGNRPIMQVIDAFIGKTTLSTTYTENSETIIISADFSNVDSSTEFIAYCCGHRHEDNIGYYEHSTHRQLCLDVVCGIGLFGDSTNSAWTNQCDLPRGGTGVSQDAFNIYAIDRVGGNVRVVRIGSNETIRFAERDVMIIPYKE